MGYPKKEAILITFLCFLTFFMAGCGQKGPLYLPDSQQTEKHR